MERRRPRREGRPRKESTLPLSLLKAEPRRLAARERPRAARPAASPCFRDGEGGKPGRPTRLRRLSTPLGAPEALYLPQEAFPAATGPPRIFRLLRLLLARRIDRTIPRLCLLSPEEAVGEKPREKKASRPLPLERFGSRCLVTLTPRLLLSLQGGGRRRGQMLLPLLEGRRRRRIAGRRKQRGRHLPLPPPSSLQAEPPPRVPVDALAAQLLRDQFVLTALQLHTELLESGRELPRLRDYFSNPGNFERQGGGYCAGGGTTAPTPRKQYMF